MAWAGFVSIVPLTPPAAAAVRAANPVAPRPESRAPAAAPTSRAGADRAASTARGALPLRASV